MAIEYRKFWLVNSLGNTYELTNPDKKVFFNNPSGFGFRNSYETKEIGNSELVTSEKYKLTDISGKLVFYDDKNGFKYSEYNNFISFIKYKPIEFHYLTPNNIEEYYCDVIITNLSKSEVEKQGYLDCSITFHRLSEWFDKHTVIKELTNTVDTTGKNYPLERPYHYAGTGLSNAELFNNGTDDIGFVFTITGEVQNPVFTLTQNGKKYGVCKINGEYDFLQINSIERYESIYLERNGTVISNPERYQDFSIRDGASYLTWTKLKVGKTDFTFNCSNIDTFSGLITIKYNYSYISV